MASSRSLFAADHVEQRCLPCPVGTQDDVPLARFHFEGDVIERLNPTKALCKASDGDGWG